MHKIRKICTLLIGLMLIFSCVSYAVVSYEDVFIVDSNIDDTILNEITSIDPDEISAESSTENELLSDIKAEPYDESLYTKIGLIYSKNKAKGFKVFSDGFKVDFTKYDNVEPSLISGRTMIPVRAIAESLGAEVNWNDATKLITITLDKKVIKLTLDSKTAQVNGTNSTLEVAATSILGRTMVPLRFVGEAFGKKVGWYPNGEVKVISIFDMQ